MNSADMEEWPAVARKGLGRLGEDGGVMATTREGLKVVVGISGRVGGLGLG